jgi:Holliday junction resolvasome RuvABC endonuclease subunit
LTRALGLDLGINKTGFAVAEPGPILITRGMIRPPSKVKDAQTKADIIVDQLVAVIARYQPDRVFIEQPILNAWGERDGVRVNMTSAPTAITKGRLVGSVETMLRMTRRRYDEIGIHRWRAIIGLVSRGKADMVVELRRLLHLPDSSKEDETEACGIAWAGLIAIQDPKVLEPGWKRPRPKTTKQRKLPEGQEGLWK